MAISKKHLEETAAKQLQRAVAIRKGSYVERRKASPMLKTDHHPKRPEIVSNIPAPERKIGGARRYDHFYPFEEMRVGDSFWVPGETQCTRGAVTKFAKKSGWRFTVRAESKDGRPWSKVGKEKRGLRVWRLRTEKR